MKATIEALIPHSGDMCLLEDVLEADDQHILCSTHSHTLVDNPLRHNQQLAAVHCCEYAAQAAALHGPWLLREQGNEECTSGTGFLAALKNITLHRPRLDDLDARFPLLVDAQRMLQNPDGLIYRFSVTHQQQPVAEGRLIVALTDN